MTNPSTTLPMLATQLAPLLASQDALELLADELEVAKQNTTPPNTSRHARRSIDAIIVRLAIEMIKIRADALTSTPGEKTEAPASPAADPP